MSSNTFRLFKDKQGFVHGMGSVFDFDNFRNKFNYTQSHKSADSEALASDWEQIGSDMRVAIKQYERSKNR